jgi:anti-sigma factor RsiW
MRPFGAGPHVGDRASDLLDGRLTPAAELQVRTHLGCCRECAAAVHREQQVRAALRSASSAAPAPGGDLMAGLLALAAPTPVRPVPVPAAVAPARPARRAPSVLTVAVLGTVSLASVGALGVAGAAVAGPALASLDVARQPAAGTVVPARSTASLVEPALTVLHGAAVTGGLSSARVVDAGSAATP